LAGLLRPRNAGSNTAADMEVAAINERCSAMRPLNSERAAGS